MATKERGFSFRNHEGHMFFIYDHKKKKEEDDPKDAILYFYPRSVKTDDQIAIVGGIIGITDFCLEFLPQEMPQIVKLSAHNIALLQHSEYIIGLAGPMDIPTNFLLAHMRFLWSTFVFYQGSIPALRQRQSEEQFLRKLNMVWDIYLPLCQSQGDLLSQAFQTIPYIKLHRSQGSLFLHASHILQRSLKHNGVLSGALFSKNKVLCTQLSNALTRKLLLLMMQTQFPSVEVNPNLEHPGGVHLIYIYLTEEECQSLNHRRKKRFSSSMEINAKESTVPDDKNSIFPDSAFSSCGDQFNSQSINISDEHHLNPNVIGLNNNLAETSEITTNLQQSIHSSSLELNSGSHLHNLSESDCRSVIGVKGKDSASCKELSNTIEEKISSLGHSLDEMKHYENIKQSGNDGFSVESLTNSLNTCGIDKGEKEILKGGGGINSSIFSNSEYNSSMDNLKEKQLQSNTDSFNDKQRKSSPNNNSQNLSSFDERHGCSATDEGEDYFNRNSEKLSYNDDSQNAPLIDKDEHFSSKENSENLSQFDKRGNSCSKSSSGNSSRATDEHVEGFDNKDIKDSDKENSFPESQNRQTAMSYEHQGGDIKEINRKLNLEIENSNYHFSSTKVVNKSKECESSSNSSSRAVQSNDIVIHEFSQKTSPDGFTSSFGGKNTVFQRYVSLEGSYNRGASLSGDDSSLQSSSCEVRKEDDQNSRKSSVNSLANSDVPSSKDRLTFEYLDSENSDLGIVSPDSEIHPMFQGNSLPISLSSLKEAEGEDVNYGSFHSCQDSEGGLTMRLPMERKSSTDDKTSKWRPQQENLTEMNLYIQGHSDTLLVLLIEKEVKCNKSYIHSLWKSCLSHLGELDFEVKNVERHSKDESENIGALYQYMKYDSFSQNLNGSAIMPVTGLANEMVDTCVRMHKDFVFMPDLVDATYRSHTACCFGRRSLNSETYFQIGLPSRGGINPGERTFHLEQTAEKCLVQDHKINLL